MRYWVVYRILEDGGLKVHQESDGTPIQFTSKLSAQVVVDNYREDGIPCRVTVSEPQVGWKTVS